MTEAISAIHMYGNCGASMHETRGPSTALMCPEVFHEAISVFMQRPEVSRHEAKIISMQKARGYRHESKCHLFMRANMYTVYLCRMPQNNLGTIRFIDVKSKVYIYL
jgi:hypothetical protein